MSKSELHKMEERLLDKKVQEELKVLKEEPDKSAPRIFQVMRFGFPSQSNIRCYGDYVLSVLTRNRSAHWVFEHLTFESVVYTAKVDRSKSDFYDDQTVHPFFRALNSDYKGSVFDQGHLAAAGNHKKRQHDMNETFVLSNIAPQVGDGFNRDKWNDHERYIRNQTKNYKNIYVCTGPLFLPQKEGDGKLYVKYQVIDNYLIITFGVIPMDRTKVLSRVLLTSSTEGLVAVLNKTVLDMRRTNKPKRTAKKKRLDVPAGKSYYAKDFCFEASETEEAKTRMLEDGVHPDQVRLKRKKAVV
ncbi:hypothetical protein QYM36_013690 [Artemia franciscana]|uniref:Endonuclease n=1 Tax=Artemia franciscana TaxID=6661 RepID=A0AA88KZ28_ARTSF|nr:hypothetical protein QYM36_013690 [Artemia franciscana]